MAPALRDAKRDGMETSAILPAQKIVWMTVNRNQEYAYQAARTAGHRPNASAHVQKTVSMIYVTRTMVPAPRVARWDGMETSAILPAQKIV